MLKDKLNTRLKRAIDSYSIYTTGDLAVFRQLFFGVFLLLGFQDFASYTANDPNLFNPPLFSLPWMLGTYPPSWFLTGLSIVLLLSSVACFFNYRLTLSLVLFVVSFVLGKSFAYSFGKVDHDDMLYPIFALLLLLHELPTRNKFHLKTSSLYFLMAFTFAFAFWGAGIPKILTGWLNPADHKFKHTIIYYYLSLDWGYLGGWMLDNIKSGFLWELLDWTAVLFECLLIFTIVRPRYFYWGIWACLIFHQFNYWTIGISFKSAMIFYLLFLPIKGRSEYIKYLLLLIVLLVPVYQIFHGSLTSVSLSSLFTLYSSTAVYFNVISILLLFLLLMEWCDPKMKNEKINTPA